MSHTPGPWTAEATTATGIRSFDILAGDEDEWSLVATVAEVHDARLIAAAPALLESVKAANVQRDPRHRISMLVNDWQRILDAIAKAEGHAP